jgi:two-component system, sensor histidine kinase and response regulator
LRQGRADSTPDLIARYSLPEASRKLRILVAEDNPVNQTVVLRMLEKMGHAAKIAANGKEALAALATESFDLVLMDVQMPIMDGLTATKNIRESEKQTGRHIPIIAMTAHVMKGDQERCLEAGMDSYIAKPLSSKQVELAISRTLISEPAMTARPIVKVAPASLIRWNRAKALEALDGDEDLLYAIVQIFLEESPKQLTKLKRAVAEVNAELLERTAHSLKGELSYLGMPAISQRARELEQMGRDCDLEHAPEVLAIFEAEVSDVIANMRRLPAAKLETVTR